MHPAVLIGLLFAAAAALTWRHLSGYLPAGAWLPVLWRPEINDPQQMLVHYTVFPRMVGGAAGVAQRWVWPAPSVSRCCAIRLPSRAPSVS